MPRRSTNGPPKLTKSGTIDKRTRAGRAAAAETGTYQPTDFGDGNGSSGYVQGSVERPERISDVAYADSRRPAPGRDESGRFQRAGTEPGPEPESRGSNPVGFIRNKLRDRSTVSDDGTGIGTAPYDPATKTGDMGGPSASVNPDGKSSSGVKGAMTPGNAERLVVSTFGLVASIRRRPHWAIKNPATEVRPWAADLAEVINAIPIPWVQAAGTFGAGVAVMVGLGSLVVPRAMTDGELNAFLAQYPPELRGAILADMAAGRGVPKPGPVPFDSNNARAETRQPEPPSGPTGPNGHHSGGAAPTSPNGLDGLLSDNGFAA